MTMGLVNAARQIESYGMGPDRQLAHISPDEAQLMDTLQGGRRVNSMTGLPQYGMFGKILKAVARVGATTAAFVLSGGNPLAAAAANAAVTKLTGGSWKQSLISGALTGVTAGLGNYASAAPGSGLSGAMSNSALRAGATANSGSGMIAGTSPSLGYASNAGGTALTSAAPSGMIAGTSPSLGFASNAGGTALMPAAANAATPSLLSQTGAFIAANPGTALTMATPSISSSFAATPAKASTSDPSFMTPDPSFGGGTLRDAGDRLASRGVTQYGGYDIPRNPTTLLGIARPGENPIDQNFGGFAGGGNVQPTGLMGASQLGYVNAKRGGTIRGPGDGKSDDIPALLSNNEHVIDAATVADAGNGDSDAGHKVFEKIKQKIRKNAGRRNPKRPSPKQRGLGSLMRAA